MSDRINPPANAPCGSCPYRTDVPSGVWEPSEYAKLPAYDLPTALQPTGVFMCHQVDGRICAGWAGCHDMTETLAVRLAIAWGHLAGDDAEALYEYQPDVELFESGQAAADHGLVDVEAPSALAVRASTKILARRAGRKASTS